MIHVCLRGKIVYTHLKDYFKLCQAHTLSILNNFLEVKKEASRELFGWRRIKKEDSYKKKWKNYWSSTLDEQLKTQRRIKI